MDQGKDVKPNQMFPVLLMPKQCTLLETESGNSENLFITLSIRSTDAEGNDICIYSGLCNMTLTDSSIVCQTDSTADNELSNLNTSEQTPLIVNDPNTQVVLPSSDQPQVWIDPARSSHVYNQFNAIETTETQENSIQHHEKHSTQITKTYTSQNIYSYKEVIKYAAFEDNEHKKFSKMRSETSPHQNNWESNNLYEDKEYECGVFLSQVPEKIMKEKEIQDKEELKYIGLQSENGALQQLMSQDVQSASKQRKTILYFGDSQCGQTLHKIAVNDPTLKCSRVSKTDREVKIGDTRSSKKKYQCDKCKQIFDQISTFRLHMVRNHVVRASHDVESASSDEFNYLCTECGKGFKTREKFALHWHGKRDLKCPTCHRVFASKSSLRAHRKIHTRKYPCTSCWRTFSESDNLKMHAAKAHFVFMCDYAVHKDLHKRVQATIKQTEVNAVSQSDMIITSPEGTTINYPDQIALSSKCGPMESSSKSDIVVTSLDDTTVNDFVTFASSSKCGVMESLSESDIIVTTPEDSPVKAEFASSSIMESSQLAMLKNEEIQKSDAVIAKVMSNKMFLSHTKKARKYKKPCNVCHKTFSRNDDLKRHLIEHVACSVAKAPPSSTGPRLRILCEVCRAHTFSDVPSYKAHLREHAKLTLYKCTFCDKSFSDSSNFSKHKKLHGTYNLQCDYCLKRFNSKQMLIRHMECHKKIRTPVKV